jgi:hypothetical protein
VSVSSCPQKPPPDAEQWPLYWFAQLEKAIDCGDYEQAAECLRRLRSLGVEVRYLPPARREALCHE